MGHVSQLSPEQIRNLCVSFAKLGYFNTQFKSVMADAVIEKLGQYDPALLADTAWAFGEALYYDYDLMTNLHTYLQSNADKFDASGLAKVRRRGEQQPPGNNMLCHAVMSVPLLFLPQACCPRFDPRRSCSRHPNSPRLLCRCPACCTCTHHRHHHHHRCCGPLVALATRTSS
jgi:hypothetical protein